MLKFFFADALDPDEQLALVRRIRAHHEALAEQLGRSRPSRRPRSPRTAFPGLTLAWGIEYQERHRVVRA